MTGRILGLETEYALVSTNPNDPGGDPPLTPKEAVRELYRPTRQANITHGRFLPNGGRLYIDLGSHPEYATAECLSVDDVVAQDRAGEELLRQMVERANESLIERDWPARLHLAKNNVDWAGNTFGCHENYSIDRAGADRLDPGLVTFLVVRTILCGGGHVDAEGEGRFLLSARAPLMCSVVSPDPTKQRPLVNAREEALADSSRWARLQVICGDSNMTDTSTVMKVALTSAILDGLDQGLVLADLGLADPIVSLHLLNVDPLADLDLADGRRLPPAALVAEILDRLEPYVSDDRSRWLGVARQVCRAVADRSWEHPAADWMVKYTLLNRYRERDALAWSDPLIRRVELAFHDLTPPLPLAARLRSAGLMASAVTDQQIATATTTPPADTRAAIRGGFAQAAEDTGRRAVIGWAHVRLDSPPQSQIDLPDPFATSDERVSVLIDRMHSGDFG